MHALLREKSEAMDFLSTLSMEPELTQLSRLQKDFGLTVLISTDGRVALYQVNDDEVERRLTQSFESLALLEFHVNENMVSILHAYLFEESLDTDPTDLHYFQPTLSAASC